MVVVGEETQLVPVESSCVADDVKVLCVIRDMTDVTRCNKVTMNLQGSTTGEALMKEVAKQYNYEDNSFELMYEGVITGPVEQVEISKCADRPLIDICENCGNGRKNNFTINEKDGSPPKSLPFSSSSSSMNLDSLSLGPIAQPTESSSYSASTDYSFASAVLKSETGFVGLVNQAMTCYLNSLLQTLYMTPEFRNALYRWEFDTSDKGDASRSIPYQLQRLFLNLQTSKRRSLETTDVTKSFGWDSSEAWQQHDVQELCRVMFDALETTWKNTDQANLINHLYQGKMKDYVKCLECGNESARVDAFLDVPLVIRPFGSNQAYGSVEEAMEAFVQHETLNGSNQYFCENCNKKCDAHKGLKFETFPYLLTLQMKRFDFDYTTMHRIKLNDKMTFPEILNLNHLIDKDNECTNHVNDNSEGRSSNESEQSENRNTGVADDVDDEGIDTDTGASGSSSLTENEEDINEKNAKKMNTEGPYEYELFSIMVHSGSAIGGHYYAYIKSFTDGQWYCFNDQHVTKITYDDIRKTYGGGTGRSGYYSASYTSSTNAYMLMYRQIDRNHNADFMQVDGFPNHLRQQIDNLKEAEEEERKQRERDRSLCKIKLFCSHPVQKKMIESRLEIHKDKTLQEATEEAYKIFELERVVPVSCVRLVKYDDYHDSLERSYEDEEETPMGTLLGGVKSNYMFDLLLEVKKPEQEFQVYKPGGVTVKVYLIDLELEDILPPVSVRAVLNQTIQDFKKMISDSLEVPLDHMKVVLERYYNDLRLLTVPNKTLKQEGFYRSNKVFVECSGTEDDVQYPLTKLNRILDRHQNTIRLHVKLPAKYELTLNRIANERLLRTECASSNMNKHENMDEGLGESETDLRRTEDTSINRIDVDSASSVSGVESSRKKTCTPTQGCEGTEESSESVNPGSSKSDSLGDVELEHLITDNLTTDAIADKETGEHIAFNEMDTGQGVSAVGAGGDVGAGGLPAAGPEDDGVAIGQEASEDWDLDNNASGETVQEEDVKRYYKSMPVIETSTGDRNVMVYVDKRITLGALKKEIEPQVGTVSENFKVYRVYTNNQEFESSRLSENLSSYSDDSKLHIKLGRALKKGEYRVKVYQLQVNEKEPSKLLFDTIFAKGMTVLESKIEIRRELKATCDKDVPLDRLRLRKKTWKNPGTIFVNDQRYEDDIPVYANWEVFVEILEDEELLTSISQLAIFARRWRPSKYELEPFQEIVLSHATTKELRYKLAEISGIEEDNVEFGKGRGTFPCDISLLEIHEDLEWKPQVTSLNAWPLYINDDGHVLYYRDKTEPLKELNEDEKKELQQKENTRMITSGTRVSYSPRKERALKIYTDHPADESSPPDLD